MWAASSLVLPSGILFHKPFGVELANALFIYGGE